jgi:hypothetical protein
MMKGKVVNNDPACIFGEADWITAEQAEWRARLEAVLHPGANSGEATPEGRRA